MTCLLLSATIAAMARPDPPASNARTPVVIEVDAGRHQRRGTPVVVPLPPSSQESGSIQLVDVKTGETIPVQVVGSTGDEAGRPSSGVVVLSLGPGEKRRFRPQSSSTQPPGRISVGQDEGQVWAIQGSARVWTYQRAIAEPPAGIDLVYRRSGFLHPLRTPSGRVLTDDFAADHPHQHGLFFAWTNTTFRGGAMNFWDQLQKTARVRQAPDSPAWIKAGPAPVARFELLHEDITSGEGSPIPVLRESWTIQTYPNSGVGPFVIDFESSQVAVGDDPLVVKQYHYGGFGYRGNIAWFDPKVTGENPPDPSRSGESEFLTSEGRTRADGNHSRPRWIDHYGKVDGAFAGIAVLQHPSNFRFPQPVRLHPNKPYFSIAPAVLGEFEIKKGTPYVSRYRLVLHDGKPDPAELDRLWNDHAEPPTARLVEDGR